MQAPVVDPRWRSVCPHREYPQQFNPLFATAEDYAEILRHGLEHSRREIRCSEVCNAVPKQGGQCIKLSSHRT